MKRTLIAISTLLLAGLCGVAQAFSPWGDMPFFGDSGFFNDNRNRSDHFQIMAPDLSINRMQIVPASRPGATTQKQPTWRLFVRVRNTGTVMSPRTRLHIYHSPAKQDAKQGFELMASGDLEVLPLGPNTYQDFYIPGEHGAMGQWTGMYLAIVDPPDDARWLGTVQELPWPGAESNNARMLQGAFSP